MMNKPLIKLTIPAQAEYIDVVRFTLYGIASKAGFSYEDIEDMKVAVSEACNNAVLHAYDYYQDGVIDVTFKLENDTIYISIKDYGSSFKYEQPVIPPVVLNNKPLKDIVPGGLGIFMMEALMDRVEIRTNSGTEIILTKKIVRNEELVWTTNPLV